MGVSPIGVVVMVVGFSCCVAELPGCSSQSAHGLHHARVARCPSTLAEGGDEVRVVSDDHLAETVVLHGVAHNAKAGAIVLMADKQPVYLLGLEAWPDEIIGGRLRVSGTLQRERIYPAAGVGVQGMEGVPFVIETTGYCIDE